MRVLYLDVLLAVNFGMDYLSLYLTGGILRLPRSRWRLLLAAVPGAVFAAVAVLFLEGSAFYPLGFVFCACGMVYIAYGRIGGLRGFSLGLLAQMLSSVILGGAISALYGIMEERVRPSSSTVRVGKAEMIMLLALLSGLLVRWVFWILDSHRGGEKVSLRIEMFHRSATVTLMTDSGNFLKDPLSGRMVLILSPRALRFLPQEVRQTMLEGKLPESEMLKRRIRMIPAGTVGGKTLLQAVIPDKVQMRDGRLLSAVIAAGKAGDYGGADGIMPPVYGKEKKGA